MDQWNSKSILCVGFLSFVSAFCYSVVLFATRVLHGFPFLEAILYGILSFLGALIYGGFVTFVAVLLFGNVQSFVLAFLYGIFTFLSFLKYGGFLACVSVLQHVILSFASAALYTILSVLVTLLNKVLIASFYFDYPTTTIMLQFGVALWTMELARMMGLLKIKSYTLERGEAMLLPSLIYSFHCYFSLMALGGMNLPMYCTIRRCVPVVSLYLGMIVLKKQKPSRGIVISVLLISAGAFLASFSDHMMDGWGYVYGVLSIVCQASYLVLVEHQALTSQYSPMELMYLNSFNGLVFFLMADMVQDEIRDAFMFFLTGPSLEFWISFGAFLALGALLNFALFFCTLYDSAPVMNLVGDIKAVIQTNIGYYMGFVFFYDIVPDITNFIGVSVNVFGCILYTYISAKQFVKWPNIYSTHKRR